MNAAVTSSKRLSTASSFCSIRSIRSGSESRPSVMPDFTVSLPSSRRRREHVRCGVPIAHEIEDTGKRPVVRAVVYATLERLQERGLVRSTMGEPTAERGGKAKRYYRVSAAGLKAVRDTQRALVALWTGIPELKGGLA